MLTRHADELDREADDGAEYERIMHAEATATRLAWELEDPRDRDRARAEIGLVNGVSGDAVQAERLRPDRRTGWARR